MEISKSLYILRATYNLEAKCQEEAGKGDDIRKYCKGRVPHKSAGNAVDCIAIDFQSQVWSH